MVCAGLIFAGCKNKDNDKDEPNTSVDPSEDLTPVDDTVAEIEEALAGHYFYSSSAGGIMGETSANLEMFFSKEGKKVTLSSKNELPWTITWQVNKDREITFKASSADPNKIYGKFQGEINKSGSTISIWGEDARGDKYEISLSKAWGSLGDRIINNLSGTQFKTSGDVLNQGGMTLNIISAQAGTAYIMHAGECRYNVTLKLNDIFKQDDDEQEAELAWNASIEATNANEKLSGSGVYSDFKDYTNEQWYGKVLKAHINADGSGISVQFDNKDAGENGVVHFSR